MANKVNINDIALRTGLSIATVSRVLNGKAEQYRIGVKSQQKIKKAAKELNYVPNHYAANLRTGKSNTISLMIPSLSNPFFAEIACSINAEIRKLGYSLIIGESDENQEIEKIELQQQMSRNIEGLIIVPCGNQMEHIKALHDQGLPVICIDRYFEDVDLPYVSTDNYDGGYAATKYLLENGHVQIACIQGDQLSTPNKLRVRGFQDAMNAAGIEKFSIVGDDFSAQNGYLETKLLFQRKIKPTAIFSLSNNIAMGCIKALKEEKVRIPDDISLLTFDDHPYLDFLATPLTCIAQPVNDICQIAVRVLYSKIKDNEKISIQLLLKPKMKIRESVRKYM